MMKKDIEDRVDIQLLVDQFYAKVMDDKDLGYIFRELAKVDLVTHLPILYDFWENAILFTGNYEGNPMELHKHLHHIMPLDETHFNIWNKLFLSTVDELFKGPKANLAKERGVSISNTIKEKLKIIA
ncbi:group III truncated hemoglobin [Arcticibacter svalbardensis]|nr:group III truncated hemoglobin [Arcticibacter svalbardensis]